MKPVNTTIALITGLILFLTTGCDKFENDPEKKWLNKIKALIEHNMDKISITEGISATILFTEGNCMPTVWPHTTDCRTYPVQRVVRIHEYTHHSQTTHVGGGFHLKVDTPLVAKITSDKEGFFEMSLSPGKYSIFIEEKDMFYANGWDGQGGVQVVEVLPEEITVIQLSITHSASY